MFLSHKLFNMSLYYRNYSNEGPVTHVLLLLDNTATRKQFIYIDILIFQK